MVTCIEGDERMMSAGDDVSGEGDEWMVMVMMMSAGENVSGEGDVDGGDENTAMTTNLDTSTHMKFSFSFDQLQYQSFAF